MISKHRYSLATVIVIVLLSFVPAVARPIVLDPAYQHDRWQTQPRDLIFEFEAFTSSFDSADDNDGDGDTDLWGIPEWVAFEIKKRNIEHSLRNRPSWFTDPQLFQLGIAPDDKTYHIDGAALDALKEVATNYRFVRGHMCPKDTAERISEDAAFHTHTLLNAVPQLQWQNNGIWKNLEERSLEWADKYEQIWVICGPVFFDRSPAIWLGQDGEKKVAVPDALYKIVIREDRGTVRALAFIIPNIIPSDEKDPAKYLTSVDRVEALTGLDFLTALSSEEQALVESGTPLKIDW